MSCTADWLAMLIASGQKSLLDDLPPEALKSALYDWTFWARPDQLPPTTNDWVTWLVLGGRGAGKTRTGAEWIAACVRGGAKSVALVGETFEDAREVMIDGVSGLCHIGPPDERPSYEASRHRLVWPNGAVGYVFSAEDPDGLRGYQFEAAWADEFAKWRQPDAVWSNLQMGLRLGDQPRQVVTTTPRPTPILGKLMKDRRVAISRATTYANKAHLAETFLSEVVSIYEGTALGRQELLGEWVEARSGAIWSWSMIEDAVVDEVPDLDRIVISVDPPVTSGPDADECGIIVCGVAGAGQQRTAYVLEDGTVAGLSPTGWAARVASLYHQHSADRIVVEVNQGGDLVEEMLRICDVSLPIRKVRAHRGKMLRAEPVAALYEKGRVKHLGRFPALEGQLTSFKGSTGEGSPDRLDALVWAVTELLLGQPDQDPKVHII